MTQHNRLRRDFALYPISLAGIGLLWLLKGCW